jgi:hypothetical protein
MLIVVTLVWAGSVVFDARLEAWTPSPYIHTIMLAAMGIIGAIYGVRRRNGNAR